MKVIESVVNTDLLPFVLIQKVAQKIKAVNYDQT